MCQFFSDSNDINFRSKIEVLDDIQINPPTKSQPVTSFEDKVLKHLNDLSEAQKSSEERQTLFEARMEKKMYAFLNDHSLMQGPSRSNQNQTHEWQHQAPVRINDQSRMHGPSRSNHNQTRQRQYHEPAPPVHDAIPDFEDFEEFDQNFPIDKFENVAELEYNIRKDLELKFLLVNLYFHNSTIMCVNNFF